MTPKNETDVFAVARSIQRKIFDKKITLHVIFQEVCVYYYFFYVLFSLDKENIYIKESEYVSMCLKEGGWTYNTTKTWKCKKFLVFFIYLNTIFSSLLLLLVASSYNPWKLSFSTRISFLLLATNWCIICIYECVRMRICVYVLVNVI